MTKPILHARAALLLAAAAIPGGALAQTVSFGAGNLVVSVEGRGHTTGTYTDNQAAPLSLFQYDPAGTSSASYVTNGDIILPQTTVGNQSAVSGEYGSSSEGTLQRSADGQSLVIMGYGVNADAFNADPTAYGTLTTDPTKSTALGQSGSLTGAGYTPVARVVAEIGATGAVDSSTALYNVYNGNNPRSVFTVNGQTFYTSGQGLGGGVDATGGVFFTTLGSHSATSVTGADAGGGTSQDTRDVQVVGNTIYASVDSKSGGTNRDYIGTLGTVGGATPYNGSSGPTQLPGFGASNGKGAEAIGAGQGNGLNAGQTIDLSPENFFFANSSTLYVADSGAPKNTSGSTSGLGDGGLQKWSLVNGKWVLDYTLAAGLGLVANTGTAGTTGLLGLTGDVVGDTVELFATNYTIGDTDQTYLYGITDQLASSSLPNGESFAELAAAPADSNFKGVAFAPIAAAVPEPTSWAMMLAGFLLVGATSRRDQRRRSAI